MRKCCYFDCNRRASIEKELQPLAISIWNGCIAKRICVLLRVSSSLVLLVSQKQLNIRFWSALLNISTCVLQDVCIWCPLQFLLPTVSASIWWVLIVQNSYSIPLSWTSSCIICKVSKVVNTGSSRGLYCHQSWTSNSVVSMHVSESYSIACVEICSVVMAYKHGLPCFDLKVLIVIFLTPVWLFEPWADIDSTRFPRDNNKLECLSLFAALKSLHLNFCL